MTVRRFVSNSARETIAIGGEIAQMLSSPTLLFLRGDLGAGKTTLVKGIAQALDAADPDEVTSPTFTLMHEYGPAGKRVFHGDLYRIDRIGELYRPVALEHTIFEQRLHDLFHEERRALGPFNDEPLEWNQILAVAQ